MAAYAALVSLMNNIEQIKSHTRLPIHFDQKQSETLLDKVYFLIDFLESYNYSHGVSQEMEDLESRITDAAYAAEDIIETHVVDRIHAHSRSRKGMAYLRYILNQRGGIEKVTEDMDFIKEEAFSPHELEEVGQEIVRNGRVLPLCILFIRRLLANLERNPYLPGIKKVMKDMDFIKEEAMKIKDTSDIDGFRTMNPTHAPSSSSTTVGKNAMVGFDHELKELLERLHGHHSSLQVIPIVGMGGKGKTTLARTAYEKPLIVQYFDFHAWVSISQEYSLSQILLGLLGIKSESSEKEEEQLGESLHKKLFGRRYLIVLDDIWSAEVCNRVMRFLPDNNEGSRIIVTTRISSLATDFGWCNLEVNFLDEEKGWDLFSEKVFGQECCPHELEEVGREIVKNCRGLPLSIVVIGGLLANSERTKKYWEYIARDTNAIIRLEGDELCMKILYLSYHNLPIHLKPCFLYMGVFPEDEEIQVSSLIKQWVAEGFLKRNFSKELKIVAKEYLDDLISRNLVIVSQHGRRGRIYCCMIHDLLRNLCLKEARKGKFLYVPTMHGQDELQSIGSQRRISIPTSNIRKHIRKHLGTRKGGFFGRSLIFPKALPLKNFGLLRVLKGSEEYSLGDTKLVNLRFISIYTSYCKKIPSSLCLFWNLQILLVYGIKERLIAPLEIWEMTELRHLEFQGVRCRVSLPDPPPANEQMNTMTNLQKIKGIINFRLSDEVVRRIPNIKSLELEYFGLTEKELEEMCLKSLSLLENLKSLFLEFKQQIGSDLLSNLTFPNSLNKLTLEGGGLHWEDMSTIASLPHLQLLILFPNAFIGHKWVLKEEEVFHSLKFLKIEYCNDLVEWISEDEDADFHFPCLEHLDLVGLDKLVELPSGIGDIPTLQMIELSDCSKSVVISAKKIMEEQKDNGNVDLQVVVFVSEVDDELESLPPGPFGHYYSRRLMQLILTKNNGRRSVSDSCGRWTMN